MSFNLYGPLNDLGYGIFTRGLIKGLKEVGISAFHLSPIGPIEMEDREEAQALAQQAQTYGWSRKFPGVAIWHEFDLNKFSGGKLVAFPIFETTEFPPIAKNYLSQMDAVCVMSKWARDVVVHNIGGSVPVFVIPGAANVLTSPEIEATPKSSAFTFLHVGKYEMRKAPIETIQAYLKAFESSSENTRLRLHCYNPFDRDFGRNISSILGQLGLRVVNSSTPHSIVAVKGSCIVEVPNGRIPAQQIFQLYKNSHIGVFPARAEGWNLPLIEAIQSGLPCIANNYSAPTEYLNSEMGYNSDLLLNESKLEVANDGIFFHGNRGYWASPSVDELADKMKHSYYNYNEVLAKFDNSKIKQTFTWQNTAKKFVEMLNAVQS